MPDPTVTDVFNQLVLANGKLEQVIVNTSLMANLNTSINAGAAATVGRLDMIAAINVESLKLQFHQTRQMDTMICMLEQISRNTCSMLNELAVQTRLQTQMAEDVATQTFIAKSANPEVALDLARHQELVAKIEECCPPERPRPPCDYVTCAKPDPAKEPVIPKIPKQDTQPRPEG